MTDPEALRDSDRVLVVDDDLILRYLAREALESAGFRVEDARDGATALDRVAAEPPDLILLDVNMPGIDGFTLCAQLREMRTVGETPVMIMTASSDVTAINRAYEVGATDFVTKPINWTILTQRIRYILRASRALETVRLGEIKLATAQRVAGLGYWELHLQSDTASLSGQAYHLLGLPKDQADIALETFWEVVHPEDLGEVKRQREAIIADHLAYRLDYRIRRPDGAERVMHEQADIIYGESGQPERILGTIQDVTDRKQAETALLAGKEAAEQASRVKNAFMANVSHEIRTPINGILGFLQLLEELSLPEEAEEAKHYIHRALGSTTDLLTIVNQLLDFSSVDDTDLPTESLDFELRLALDDRLALLRDDAEYKGLTLTWFVQADVPAWVSGNPGGLHQILTHIVGNAIKFTEVGEINVRVRTFQEEGASLLRFEVQDTGIGIAVLAQESLFQPFFQEDDSATRRYGGTGLGLTIANSWVERLGGEMGVDSEPGVGSTFWFTLPLTPRPASPPLVTSELLTLEGKRVLCVDDHPTSAGDLKSLLESWGLLASIASDGDQALDILQASASQPYDLVVLAHRPNGLDGIELARRIRSELSLAATRFILLSQVGQLGEGLAAKRAGVSVYLVQPVQPEQLYSSLGLVLHPRTNLSALITRHRVSEARLHRMSWILVAAAVERQKNPVQMLQSLGYRVDVVSDVQVLLEVLPQRPYTYLFFDTALSRLSLMATTALIRAREAGTDQHLPIIAIGSSDESDGAVPAIGAGVDAILEAPLQVEALVEALERLLPAGGQAATPASQVISLEVEDTEASLWATLLADYGVELATEVCKTFLTETPALMGLLREAWSQGDVEGWERTLLRLQGSSTSLGATSLETLCKRMPQRPDSSCHDDDLMVVLEDEFKRLKSVLEAALG